MLHTGKSACAKATPMKDSASTKPPRSARLFTDPAAPSSAHVAFIDGASRGNPGPASYAVIVRAPDGKEIFRVGKYIGRTTNNVAEYYALIAALDYATAHKLEALRVRSDSELLVRQMLGNYKVKSPDLRPLHERARKLAAALPHFSVQHVPREANRDADRLANSALDVPSGLRAGQREAEIRNSKYETRAVRARYANGALIPDEPVGLSEGDVVELIIRRRP